MSMEASHKNEALEWIQAKKVGSLLEGSEAASLADDALSDVLLQLYVNSVTVDLQTLMPCLYFAGKNMEIGQSIGSSFSFMREKPVCSQSDHGQKGQ